MNQPTDAETFVPYNVPRDGASVAWFLGVGALAAGVLLMPPFLIGYRIHGDFDIARRYVLVACLFMCVLVPPYIVWSVTIDGRGLRFRRLIGSPKFLSWSRITNIQKVPRREAILQGSLFPWQAPSTAVSYQQTFRIDWGRRRFYFPPRDVAGFRTAVNRWRPDLVAVDAEPPRAAEMLPDPKETGNPYQSPRSDLIRRPEEE